MSGIADGHRWDPTPALVLGVAVPISMMSYQLVDGWSFLTKNNVSVMKKPLCAQDFSNLPQNKVVDLSLVLGSACLGIGWTMGLLCPGGAMVKAALGDVTVLSNWIPSYCVGSLFALQIKNSFDDTNNANNESKKL